MLFRQMGFAGATDVLQPCARGRQLGAFQLLAELSRGRRTTSYAALDGDGSLKLLRIFHELSSPEALEAELSTARGLRLGAALPRVEAEDGQVFAVDALLVGESLASALTRIVDAETPMPPEVAVSTALLAIRSLRRAATRHGDLIPAHVLLSFEGDVWLIDPVGAELGARRALEGRAPYHPPELRGAARATELSDLYQLGGGLFEAVSACPLPVPGAAPDLERTSAPDMSQVPEALHRALHRLLRTRPESRFPGIEAAEAALAGSLGEVQLGSAVIARWMRTFFSDRLARWRALVLRPAEQARAAGASQVPRARVSPSPFEGAAPVECVDAATEAAGEPSDIAANRIDSKPATGLSPPAVTFSDSPNAWSVAAERGPQLGSTDEAETTTRALALTPPGLWSDAGEPVELLSEDSDETRTHEMPLVPPASLAVGAEDRRTLETPLFRPLSAASADWSSVPWSALVSESHAAPDTSETPQVAADWIPPEAITPDRPVSPAQAYQAPADPSELPARRPDMCETVEEQDLSRSDQDALAKLSPLIISRAPPASLGGATFSDFSNGQAQIPTQIVRLRGEAGGAVGEAEAAPERTPTREDSVELEISFSEIPEDSGALGGLSEALEPPGDDPETGGFFAPGELSAPPTQRERSAPTLIAPSDTDPVEGGAPPRRRGLWLVLALFVFGAGAAALWFAATLGVLPSWISEPLQRF